jgi:hypothetical protein
VRFGLSTKSPLTFFSASAGAAGTVKAIALTSIVPNLRDSGGVYSFLFIVFKVLMVSSYLLGMFLFCCRKRKENNYELRI